MKQGVCLPYSVNQRNETENHNMLRMKRYKTLKTKSLIVNERDCNQDRKWYPHFAVI